jgi:hypothetical protein
MARVSTSLRAPARFFSTRDEARRLGTFSLRRGEEGMNAEARRR